MAKEYNSNFMTHCGKSIKISIKISKCPNSRYEAIAKSCIPLCICFRNHPHFENIDTNILLIYPQNFDVIKKFQLIWNQRNRIPYGAKSIGKGNYNQNSVLIKQDSKKISHCAMVITGTALTSTSTRDSNP